jgi:membrane complex biogenesis BtpA family protein
MLHVPALPGSPKNTLGLNEILDWVLNDAQILSDAGIDGWILENFGDAPFYPRRTPAHTVAFMTALGREVKKRFDVALGINLLRNDAEGAIAVATAVGAEFIRVNIHTGAQLTDQGLIEGTAHETLRYRKLLGSDVAIFADVDVKHSAPLAVRPLSEQVEETLTRGCADAVIVTGSATGQPASLNDLQTAKRAAGEAPVLVGSGVSTANVADVLRIADGLIVGTAFKRDGRTINPVDAERVRALLERIRQ